MNINKAAKEGQDDAVVVEHDRYKLTNNTKQNYDLSENPPMAKRLKLSAPETEWKHLDSMCTEGSCVAFNSHAVYAMIDDHRLFAAGKRKDSSLFCEYYDSKTRKWNLLSNTMRRIHSVFGAQCIEGKVYILYNYGSIRMEIVSIDLSGGGNEKNIVDYSTRKTTPDTIMHSATTALHLKYMYVFGVRDKPQRYSTDTDKWQSIPNMPTKREFAVAAALGDKIYVVSGRDSNFNSITSTDVFNTSTQQWEQSAVPDMNQGRQQASAVVVDDQYLVVVGGCGASDLSTIKILDTKRNVWMDGGVKLRHKRIRPYVGYFKKTKEFLVGGGGDDDWSKFDTAESIPFCKLLVTPDFIWSQRETLLPYMLKYSV